MNIHVARRGLVTGTHVIYGPPGTGKTTKMLSYLERSVNEGVPLDKICYLTFTKKAATEARERIIATSRCVDPDLTWFRTIHSLAYVSVKRREYRLMQGKHYDEVCAGVGLRTSAGCTVTKEGLSLNATTGDKVVFLEELSRVRCCSLRQINEQFDWEVDLFTAQRYAKELKKYKKANRLADYTDFLQIFLEDDRLELNFRHIFVDEAQDLSKLQWKVIDKISTSVEMRFIAGDDDQAIFNWAGADVKSFLKLNKTSSEVLDQSYRVPPKVLSVATGISDQIKFREEKVYRPRPDDDEHNTVDFHTDYEDLDLSQGTWFLLARNKVLLKEWNELCYARGVLYESQLEDDHYLPGFLQALGYWGILKRGEKISAEQALHCYKFMGVGKGFKRGNLTKLESMKEGFYLNLKLLKSDFGLLLKDSWWDQFTKVSDGHKLYISQCLDAGEKISDTPRIHISTMHSVKGGEADNVAILSDMTRATWDSSDRNPDNEHRVWYVGVTRAKKNLHIIVPRTKYYYDIA